MNVYEAVRKSCRDTSVTVNHVRSVLLFSTNYLFLSAREIIDMQTNEFLSKAELCNKLVGIEMMPTDMRQYEGNLRKMNKKDYKYVQQGSFNLGCLTFFLPVLRKRNQRLRQLMESTETVAEFRNQILMEFADLCCIHIVRPDGIPRKSKAELYRALLYYPFDAKESYAYLKLIAVAVVTIAGLYYLYSRGHVPIASTPTTSTTVSDSLGGTYDKPLHDVKRTTTLTTPTTRIDSRGEYSGTAKPDDKLLHDVRDAIDVKTLSTSKPHRQIPTTTRIKKVARITNSTVQSGVPSPYAGTTSVAHLASVNTPVPYPDAITGTTSNIFKPIVPNVYQNVSRTFTQGMIDAHVPTASLYAEKSGVADVTNLYQNVSSPYTPHSLPTHLNASREAPGINLLTSPYQNPTFGVTQTDSFITRVKHPEDLFLLPQERPIVQEDTQRPIKGTVETREQEQETSVSKDFYAKLSEHVQRNSFGYFLTLTGLATVFVNKRRSHQDFHRIMR